MARADLWVYNAENFCVSVFNQVSPIFHLRGGKIKKKVFWAYLVCTIEMSTADVECETEWHQNVLPLWREDHL